MIATSPPSLDSEASIRTSENLSSRYSDGRSHFNISVMMLPTVTPRCKWWRTSASPGDTSFSRTTPVSKAMGYDPGLLRRITTHRSNTLRPRQHGPQTYFCLDQSSGAAVGKGKALLGGVGGIANRIVGGWSFSGTMTWESGLAFSPSYSSCGVDRDTGLCRPNLVGSVHVTGSRDGYFATTGGVPLELHGTTWRHYWTLAATCCGDVWKRWEEFASRAGFFQADVSLAENESLKERGSIQLRSDIFNLFNKVNLDNPIGCVDCPDGGIIINAAFSGGALQRQIMFSLRFEF
jgi:hypothetical protein